MMVTYFLGFKKLALNENNSEKKKLLLMLSIVHFVQKPSANCFKL